MSKSLLRIRITFWNFFPNGLELKLLFITFAIRVVVKNARF